VSAVVCVLRNEPQPGYDAPIPEERDLPPFGVRSLLLFSYDLGRHFFAHGYEPPENRHTLSPVRWANEVGCWMWCYFDPKECPLNVPRTKRMPVDVEPLVENWKRLVVGLATAHDKDEADRYEAAIDDCLTPLLKAPVKQVREFAVRLRDSLKADPAVPYLVWRAYETWIDKVVLPAADEDVMELKAELAQEIVGMVEDEAKRDLPAAMVRALQWRSPERLAEVKDAVMREKQAGRGARLKGRESCLFLEIGGTEAQPEVCIQV